MLRVFRRLGGSSPEAVARRATNDERFGPSQEDLSTLTSFSFKAKSCDRILQVVDHRFRQNRRHWRQRLKALTVLQYFIMHGSPQCIEWMSSNQDMIKGLTEFVYVDQYNVDQGRAVRDKAQSVLSFVQNPEKIEQAKQEYRRQRENVRKSIGTGRPSTTSRNTLEMLRDNLFEEEPEPPSLEESTFDVPTVNFTPDRGGGLCAIEEEH